MEPTHFYQSKAIEVSSNSESLPAPISLAQKGGSKTRIQIAYEMLCSRGPFDNLLDLGCGNLNNLLALQNLFGRGFGVDIAAYPIWKTLSSQFTTCEHNLDSGPLPFADGVFEAVTILMVLEHVFDPFTVIEEISRVSKPNSYLVINVPNIAYIKHRFGLLLGQLPNTSTRACWEMREWDGGHIHYFTLERLTWLLQKFGGYQVLEVQSSGKLGQIKRLYPALLCSDLQLLCRKES